MAVSFILFAYQQEDLVEEAVRAILAQDCDPLDIILSDDRSSDGTLDAINRAVAGYSGPHHVRVRRSAKNRGVIRHVADAVEECRGDLIIIAAGDDLSEPFRARKIVARWEAMGRKSAVIYSDFSAISPDGTVLKDADRPNPGPHSLLSLARGPEALLGATFAVTRDLFTSFPPIDPAVLHEDRVLPFRALLLGGEVSFIDEPLVRYRVQGGFSRIGPVNLHDFLTRFSATFNARVLPDARQRLDDAIAYRPDDTRLHRACRATIADHRMKLEMAGSERRLILLLRSLIEGARPVLAIKHYLKFLVARANGR